MDEEWNPVIHYVMYAIRDDGQGWKFHFRTANENFPLEEFYLSILIVSYIVMEADAVNSFY